MPSARRIIIRTEKTQIVSYNVKRIVLALANLGNYTIYLSPDHENIRDEGFPLMPGMMLIFRKKDGDKTDMALYAIADNESELRIWEEWE